ncbi:MAG TPA: tetratricopeptide repeat protein [Flavobacteriales bacterium]|nr:tetratricopeptide repeat protein [Flavobacteriales bacterium]
MLRCTAICSLLFYVAASFAQSLPLSGTVTIQNSAYETGKKVYVSDARIRAPFAKATTSDRQGAFTLAFVGVARGTAVPITVEKTGLEVVNMRELQQVVAGGSAGVQVVMAEAGKLAAARTAFYNVATASINEAFKRRMDVLRDTTIAVEQRIAMLNKELADTLRNMEAAVERITAQHSEALARSGELAERFAAVDLDDVSATYRKAYELYRNGNVDSVLALLRSDRLDKEYSTALAQKQQGGATVAGANTSIRQLVQSYRLKADVQETRLQYAAAIATEQRIHAIMSEQADAFEPLELVRSLHDLVLLEQVIVAVDSALAHAQRGVQLAEQHLPVGHPEIAAMHSELALVLMQMSRYGEATTEVEKAIALELAHPGDSLGLAYAYNARGKIKIGMGTLEGAMVDLRLALGIWQRHLEPDHPRIAQGLFDMADPLLGIGSLDEGRLVAEQSLIKRKGRLVADHPEIAASISILARAMHMQGRFDEAVEGYAEAGRILRASLGEDHPHVANIHVYSGLVLKDLDRNPLAMAQFDTALAIQHRLLGPLAAANVDVHKCRSEIYLAREDMVGAQRELGSAVAIARQNGMLQGMKAASLLADQGALYGRKGDLDSALWCFDGARTALIAERGPLHLHVADLETQIGRLYHDHRMTDSALVHLRSAQHIYKRVLPSPHQSVASVWDLLASTHERAGNFPECAACADSSGHEYTALFGPDDPSAMIWLVWGIKCRVKGRFDMQGARVLADRAVAVANADSTSSAGDRALAYTFVARVQKEEKDLEGAITSFRSGLSASLNTNPPDTGWAGYMLCSIGEMEHLLGRDDRAIATLDSSLAIHPDHAPVWQHYIIARDAGKDDETLRRLIDYHRVIAHYPVGSKRPEADPDLKLLATRMKRQDVLKEFGLE